MSYSGSTASSSVANPPAKVTQGIAAYDRSSTALSTAIPGVKQGASLWLYNSTNKTTDMTVANFFSDAYDIGIRPGDIVMGIQYSSAASSGVLFFGGITGVSTSGAALSTGCTITSTFG